MTRKIAEFHYPIVKTLMKQMKHRINIPKNSFSRLVFEKKAISKILKYLLYCGVYLSLNHQLHGTVWIKSRQTTEWDILLGLNTIKVEWEYLLQYGGLRRCLWLYWALVPYDACYVRRRDCSWSTVSFIWQCDSVTPSIWCDDRPSSVYLYCHDCGL